MATFGKINISNCGNTKFSQPMHFTCKKCGHQWVASSGAACPKCNGSDLMIKSQEGEKK